MGNIPLVTSREPVRVGAPESRATGQMFGAQIGEALAGLGGTIAQVGQSVGSAFEARAAKASQLSVANAVAGYDATKVYNDTLAAAPADGNGLYDGMKETLSQNVDDYLKTLNLSPKEYEEARIRLTNQNGELVARAANDEFKLKTGAAKTASDDALNTQLNRIRGDITQYDSSLENGLAVIDSQTNMLAADKEAAKNVYRSQAAAAYFDAGINAARTPEEIATLEKELKDEKWQDELGANEYAKIQDNLAQAGKTYTTAMQSEITAGISAMKQRIDNPDPKNPVSDEQLAALGADIAQYGSEKQKREWNELRIGNDAMRSNLGLPPSQIKQNIAGYSYNAQNGGPPDPTFSPVAKPGTDMEKYGGLSLDLEPRTQNAVTYAGQIVGKPFELTSGNRGFPVDPKTGQPVAPGTSGAITYNDWIKITGRSPGAAWDSAHEHGGAIDYDPSQFGNRKGEAISALRKAGFNWFKFYPDGHVHAEFRANAGVSDPQFASGEEKAALTGSVPGGVASADFSWGNTPANVQTSITVAAQSYGVRPEFLARIWKQESGGKTGYVEGPMTRYGTAKGPFQFIDDTARRYGVNVHDFDSSARGAAHYLSDLLKRYNGNETLAAAAYNWGEGNVDNWIANGSNPASMPAETRNYIAKVTGGGVSYAGVGSGSYTQAIYAQKALDYQTKQMNNDMVTFFTDLNKPGLPDISPLTDASSFTERSQAIEALAAYAEMNAKDIKPFSAEEAAQFSQIMAGDDTNAKLDLMAKISTMTPAVRQYAYDQLSQKDKGFAFAASTYGRDNGATARDIVNGTQRWEGPAGTLIKTANVSEANIYENFFLASLGQAANGLKPDQINATFTATNAVMAERFKGTPTTPWNPSDYQQALYDVMGLQQAPVNGVDTLLPKEVNPDDVNLIIENGGIDDWAALSVNKMPPVDQTGQPVSPDVLALEAKLVAIDDQGTYVVTNQENQQYVTAAGPDQAYQMRLEPDAVRNVAASIREETVTPQIRTPGPSPNAPTSPAFRQFDKYTSPDVTSQPAAPTPTTGVAPAMPGTMAPEMRKALTRERGVVESRWRKDLEAAGIKGKALDAVLKEQLDAWEKSVGLK